MWFLEGLRLCHSRGRKGAGRGGRERGRAGRNARQPACLASRNQRYVSLDSTRFSRIDSGGGYKTSSFFGRDDRLLNGILFDDRHFRITHTT